MGKKTLSWVLAVAMLLSMVPMSAAAAEVVADEVIYNLGNHEVTVGYDVEQSELPWQSYELFDENSGFVIPLEDNAFFPYEVQFQVNGETFVEWFATPDSLVEVGGHVFSVHSEQNDDAMLTQIGVWIDGQYIAAYPEAKEFTNPAFMPMSLLPIQVKTFTLDLKGLTITELEAVKLSYIYAQVDNSLTTQKAAWVKKTNRYNDYDEYQIVESDATLDLTPPSSNSNDSFNIELIVGSAKQLDPTNVRYSIDVQTESHLFDDVDLYSIIADSRDEVIVKNLWRRRSDTYTYYQARISDTVMQAATGFYVGLQVNNNYDIDNFKIYKGQYSSAEAAVADMAEDVTDDLLADNMSVDEAGYYLAKPEGRTSISQYFTVIIDDGTDTYVEVIRIYLYSNTAGVDLEGLYGFDGTNWRHTISNWDYSSSANGVQVVTLTLNTQYPADAEYYAGFSYYTYDENLDQVTDNSKVTHAFLGHYDSLAAAAGKDNIKEKLLVDDMYNDPESGYKGNYSGDGIDFTIIAEDGSVYKYTIITIDRQLEEDSLSQDRYFYVTGADGISSYTMPYHTDSYYNKGYQTVLLLDDTADLLKTLKPTFWNNPLTKIFASVDGVVAATEQASKVTEVDFSNGAVVYTARAESTDIKNYNVTFVQQVDSAARLFVNGPTYEVIAGDDEPEDPITRELFLENEGSYHDIFIANVGKEALTGLTVELSNDAGAVKLDDYWVVGGDDNNKLAGFTSTSYNPNANGASSNYNEIANVAKIRLIADGMGAIGGKLTIFSDNGGTFDVYLTGVAGNPDIITSAVGNATKYVPYSVMIQTNNYNDSLDQTFSLESGSLPSGVSLLPNGEIYGVPTVTGNYTFTVKVSFDSDTFHDATKEFTLTVLDNTDTNVNAASVHPIDVRVPDTITSYQSQVFEIDNAYGDFMDFYLDGQKLAEGVDYDSEEGSTRITIRSQTFQRAGNGSHTIAAEFRKDGDADQEMTAAAQNYKASIGSVDPGPGPSPNPPSSGTTTPTAPADKVTVTAPENGTVSLSTSTPKKGDKVTVTVKPEYGYELESLTITDKSGKALDYTDNGDGTFTFTYGGSEVDIKATFVMVSTALPFSDVFAPDWYLKAVQYAYEKGLLIGISATEFAPTMATSRAMMITVLHRIAGTPAPNASSFTDVPADAWYSDAANWAAEAGIVTGVGNNRFAPDSAMTREQMAVMLYNFCIFMGVELPEVSDLEIADGDKVSSWALEAVTAMYKAGILQGKGDGLFDPKGTATRAEIAALLEKFMPIFEEPASSEEGDDSQDEVNP